MHAELKARWLVCRRSRRLGGWFAGRVGWVVRAFGPVSSFCFIKKKKEKKDKKCVWVGVYKEVEGVDLG